jgi:SAM-dependent methyltransferase
VLKRADTRYSPSLIPPDELTKGDIGPGDFRAVGEHFLEHFIEVGNLAPTDRVLDIGCGSGRIAAPLTVFLHPTKGAYEGFDVTEPGVSWCQVAYREYPNFRFRHARIRSDFYGISEGVPAEEYRFPYRDGEFDFVFLTSIFTHLLPAVVNRNLDEIFRVLKTDGTCFATYFLIDPPALVASRDTPPALKFHRLSRAEPVWATDPDRPEAVTGYEVDYVLNLYEQRRFQVVGVHRGRWPVVFRVLRPEAKSWQDIIVARKR